MCINIDRRRAESRRFTTRCRGRRGGPRVKIKSEEPVAGDFFKDLARWRSLSERSTPASVVYGGRASYVRGGVDVRAWRDWA